MNRFGKGMKLARNVPEMPVRDGLLIPLRAGAGRVEMPHFTVRRSGRPGCDVRRDFRNAGIQKYRRRLARMRASGGVSGSAAENDSPVILSKAPIYTAAVAAITSRGIWGIGSR